jgi:hypothetical protein
MKNLFNFFDLFDFAVNEEVECCAGLTERDKRNLWKSV